MWSSSGLITIVVMALYISDAISINDLLGKPPKGVFALCRSLRPPTFVVVRGRRRCRRPSQSERFEYLENVLTWNHQTLHRHQHQQTLMSCDTLHHYNFRSEVIATLSRKRFKRTSSNFIRISGKHSHTKLLNRLQNATKYYTKVHKVGAVCSFIRGPSF